MSSSKKKMVILYGKGGTADCGRHAVEVALLRNIDEVLVLTQYPELLEETNWNCACPGGHSLSEDRRKRLTVVKVDDNWEANTKGWSIFTMPRMSSRRLVIESHGKSSNTIGWPMLEPPPWSRP